MVSADRNVFAFACGGVSTIAAAQATRRVGVYAALLMSQLLGAAFLGLLAMAMSPSLTYLHGLTLPGLAAGGLLSLLGWLTYYRALERGPVGVVGAVAATYGGVAAILPLLVLGERGGASAAAGVVLTVGGVCLAAAQSSGRRVAGPATRSGVFLAVVSALTYGVGSFAIGGFSARVGWLTTALVAYGSSVAALVLALPFQMRNGFRSAAADRHADALMPAAAGQEPPAALVLPHEQRPVRWRHRPGYHLGFVWSAVAGLAEGTALAAFSQGGESGQVMVTSAVSSLYPVIPLAAGLLLFQERLRCRQVVGVFVIVAGLVMISGG